MVRSFFFSETEKDLRAYIPSCVGMHRRTYPSPAIKLTTRPQIWSMGGPSHPPLCPWFGVDQQAVGTWTPGGRWPVFLTFRIPKPPQVRLLNLNLRCSVSTYTYVCGMFEVGFIFFLFLYGAGPTRPFNFGWPVPMSGVWKKMSDFFPCAREIFPILVV